MVAAALLDGEVTPKQYTPERILRGDVQALLRRVIVRPDEALSRRFPQEMPCRIRVFLKDGQTPSIEQRDYEGFYTRPMSWEKAAMKFARLAAPFADERLQQSIVETVSHLETVPVGQLTTLLAKARNKHE
jgi:2-methylcitrate dehydratase